MVCLCSETDAFILESSAHSLNRFLFLSSASFLVFVVYRFFWLGLGLANYDYSLVSASWMVVIYRSRYGLAFISVELAGTYDIDSERCSFVYLMAVIATTLISFSSSVVSNSPVSGEKSIEEYNCCGPCHHNSLDTRTDGTAPLEAMSARFISPDTCRQFSLDTDSLIFSTLLATDTLHLFGFPLIHAKAALESEYTSITSHARGKRTKLSSANW